MKRRMILMLATMALFIGAVGFVKFTQIRAAIAQGASWQPPPEAVTTLVAKTEDWPATLSAIGSVAAVHGVTVSADLSGIVEKIAFDSGRQVGAGDVLVRLDSSQEEAQLAAAEAGRRLARLNLERVRGLLEKGVVSQAEFDRMTAESEQAEARVGEIRATIERKTIRAPFAGALGIRQVNLGQFLNGGDPVVPLQTLDPIYVNFSVPQQDLGDIGVGDDVSLAVEGVEGGPFLGRISAVNSVIDEATRNIQVQATFENPGGHLRPGMYVETQVRLGEGQTIVALPGSAVHYAPYGNSVFIVEEMKAPDGTSYRGVRQQFVKLGPARGDQVAVLDGVKPGEEVVTSGVFKLRNGAAVVVDNSVVPSNDPSPRPEDS